MRRGEIVQRKHASKRRRHGAAAAEMALCLPLLMVILTGLFQIGRIVQIQQVLWNSAREAARDASLGDDNLSTVASSLLSYLQAADSVAFGSGHSTSMISPVITLPANAQGYTCWDNTANRELFTYYFLDSTNTSVTDPTGMSQLDTFQLAVQVPYNTVAFTSAVPISGATRLAVKVNWVAMVDSPFSITPSLPAQ